MVPESLVVLFKMLGMGGQGHFSEMRALADSLCIILFFFIIFNFLDTYTVTEHISLEHSSHSVSIYKSPYDSLEYVILLPHPPLVQADL